MAIPGLGNLSFSTKVIDFVFPPISDAGRCNELVDVTTSVSQALEIVNKYIDIESDPVTRVPPLMISRLGRGGKTTLLYLIFDSLKKAGLTPIYINFNGKFKMFPKESQKEALLRMIALQVCEGILDKNLHYIVDEKALLGYFDTLYKEKQVVLIVDELNSLSDGLPLQFDASWFLKENFLDKKYRYLIFSTHIPLNVDNTLEMYLSGAKLKPSPRGVKLIDLPKSYNLEKLRGMSKPCQALTALEAVIYGGIPSLIFVTKENHLSPSHRFDLSKLPSVLEESSKSFIGELVKCLLTGNIDTERITSRLLEFSIPVKNHILGKLQYRWPLCYIPCIFELAGSQFKYVNDIYYDIASRAKSFDSGLEFESFIQLGIIFQCLDASCNGKKGPFGIVTSGNYPEFMYCILSDDITSLKGAYKYVDSYLARQQLQIPSKSNLLFVTFSCSTFPDIDGLIVYQIGKVVSYYGIQMKSGRKYPRKNVSDKLTAGYLIQGNPPSKRNKSQESKWIKLSKTELRNLVGFSLQDIVNVYSKEEQ